MKCEICNKSATQPGIALFRVNELGGDGIWRCQDHMTEVQQAAVDSEVKTIVEAMQQHNSCKVMKVFRINNYEWWIAPTLEEAIAAAKGNCDWDGAAIDRPAELTEAEMETHVFLDRDEDTSRSFREELERRIKSGQPIKPELFACTEF